MCIRDSNWAGEQISHTIDNTGALLSGDTSTMRNQHEANLSGRNTSWLTQTAAAAGEGLNSLLTGDTQSFSERAQSGDYGGVAKGISNFGANLHHVFGN